MWQDKYGRSLCLMEGREMKHSFLCGSKAFLSSESWLVHGLLTGLVVMTGGFVEDEEFATSKEK